MKTIVYFFCLCFSLLFLVACDSDKDDEISGSLNGWWKIDYAKGSCSVFAQGKIYTVDTLISAVNSENGIVAEYFCFTNDSCISVHEEMDGTFLSYIPEDHEKISKIGDWKIEMRHTNSLGELSCDTVNINVLTDDKVQIHTLFFASK